MNNTPDKRTDSSNDTSDEFGFEPRGVRFTEATFTFSKNHWIVISIILPVLFLTWSAWYATVQYNNLQRQDEYVDAMWSKVLSQYARRADLIPNLVTVVKSYAANESELYGEITNARAQLNAISKATNQSRDPLVLDQFTQAQNQLSAQLSRLLLVAQKYPELKSSALFQDLMVELAGTENRINYSRSSYIEAIAEYNMVIRTFPTNVMAKQTGLTSRPKFNVENEAMIGLVPKVDLR
ncbi:LemA family protein [Undibacterium sp. Dicai25W]|uniref:LemA family protein n=1 Tax=Undibacterium sp. Dicai25W TaxID=3413034 RepID=UPI003BF056DF